ncbi:hypothetical protein BQ6471_00961 [Vibrio gazogenes]|nr:hypothetical protein BQ6471_00961 [Vibrio gazogenes]
MACVLILAMNLVKEGAQQLHADGEVLEYNSSEILPEE